MGAVGRARHEAPFTHASQAFLAHHSPHALGVHAPALCAQRVGAAPATVTSPAHLVDLDNRFPQRRIRVSSNE